MAAHGSFTAPGPNRGSRRQSRRHQDQRVERTLPLLERPGGLCRRGIPRGDALPGRPRHRTWAIRTTEAARGHIGRPAVAPADRARPCLAPSPTGWAAPPAKGRLVEGPWDLATPGLALARIFKY